MEQLLAAMRAAHIELTAEEQDHVLEAAKNLLALTDTLPDSPAEPLAPVATPVAELRADEAAHHALRPEQFAPAVQDGFIRVPRVID